MLGQQTACASFQAGLRVPDSAMLPAHIPGRQCRVLRRSPRTKGQLRAANFFNSGADETFPSLKDSGKVLKERVFGASTFQPEEGGTYIRSLPLPNAIITPSPKAKGEDRPLEQCKPSREASSSPGDPRGPL